MPNRRGVVTLVSGDHPREDGEDGAPRQADHREHDVRLAASPPMVAALAMLLRALGHDDDAPQVPRLLVLVASDAAWVPELLTACRLHLHGGRRPCQPSLVGVGPVEPGEWLALTFEGRRSTLVEETGRMMAAGGSVVVVVAHRHDIPAVIAAGADRVVDVPSLDHAMLAAVAEALHGPGQDRLLVTTAADGEAVAISPAALMLAMRPGIAPGRYASAVLSIARAQATASPAGDPRPSAPRRAGPHGLARVPGLGGALVWGQSLAADLTAYRAGRLPWADVARGCVLVGPPGTGKTTFGRALAEECGVPLVLGSHGQWQSAGHQGEMLKAMRRTFAEARDQAPCILLVDEVDSFTDRARERSENATYVREVVNAFLSELDGATSREGVVVVGACNSLDWIEPALLRAGRLDRVIRVDLPGVQGRAEILRVHLGFDLLDGDLWQVARIAEGMSGADLEKAVREARRAARSQGRPLLLGDLLVAVAGEREMELLPRCAGKH